MRQLNRVRRRRILPASIKAIEVQVDISYIHYSLTPSHPEYLDLCVLLMIAEQRKPSLGSRMAIESFVVSVIWLDLSTICLFVHLLENMRDLRCYIWGVSSLEYEGYPVLNMGGGVSSLKYEGDLLS